MARATTAGSCSTAAESSFTAAGTLAPVLTSSAGNISANFVPAIGQTFGIVQAEGGVLGSFSGLTQPDGLAPGTRLDALYGPDAIALVVTPADFSDLASLGIPETPNQSAIGGLLDLVRPEGGQMTPGQQALFQSLYTLPSTSITAAINELSPEIYADALMTTRNAWYLMANAIGGQLEARRGLAESNTASSAAGAQRQHGLGERHRRDQQHLWRRQFQRLHHRIGRGGLRHRYAGWPVDPARLCGRGHRRPDQCPGGRAGELGDGPARDLWPMAERHVLRRGAARRHVSA